MHKPASYHLIVQGFVLVSAFFKSQALLFVSASFFFFILIVYSFFEKFFNVFSFWKQNNGKNILQNGESLMAMKHDGSCCEDFL